MKMADGKQRFSLRRLNVGTVSVLIGTIFFFGAAGTASADTVPTDTSVNVTTSTDQTSSTDSQSVVLSKTASASDASTVVNSASASAASDNSSLASSTSTASTSVSTADLLSSATVTSSTAVSASDGSQSAASPQKVNALAALDTNLTVNTTNIPANVARNYKGVAWANYDELNYDDIKYADKSYYDNKPITNGVLNVSSTDPLPDNWTTTLKQPSAGVPVPKFSDSSSKTYYTFASVKDINNNTEVGSYVATKNLTDDQLVVTYFEKTGDTYAQKNSVQLTQGQTTTLGSVSIEYPSGSEIIMTPNDGSTLQPAYHYMNTASTSPDQKVTFSVPTYAEQTIEFIDITTGKNVFTPIKRQILVGSQYKTVPFQDISYDIIAPSNDSGTATNSLNPNTINIVYYYKRVITPISKPTSQYILYQGAGNQTPPSITDNYDLAGELNNDTGEIYWYEDSHTYDAVNTPVVTGYYADKAVVPERTATIDNPEVDDTVTYKPLGKIIPVDQNGKEIANTSKTYENDPDDPTKATTTKTPDIKGYEKSLQEVTPDNPGKDTKVTYTPIINQVEVPTSQTVKYEGAGDLTPKDNEQKDFTFYKMISEATGEVLFWNVTDHTYDSVNTPVVEGYYADTAVVPGQTVTHDQPNVEVTVTYKPLGKIIPVDSDGNPIPGAETPTYENDPDDPTKTTTTKTPDIKGYKKSLQEVTPDNPGKDTKVTYTPIINEVTVPTSQTVKYEGAGDQTPKDNVQNDYTFTGKSNEATGKTTWDEATHAYKPVKTPVVEGYYADTAVVPGQTVTHDQPNAEVTVTYKPLGKIIPVDSDGNPIPGAETPTYENDPDDPTKTTTTKTPDIKGYKKSLQEVTPDNPGKDTKVVYTPIIKDATLPTSQTVKYEGAGDLTPEDNVQNDYTFTGKSNEATSKTTWDEETHAYKPVKTPVIPGYYADVASVDNIVLTPEHPTEEVTVKYRALGRIVPIDPEGNVIPNAPMPTYSNDPSDPTKTTTTPVPKVPGYTTTTTEVTPDDPSANTQITYTPIINEVTVPTSQTVKYEGAGDLTPKDNVQNDYTFTGKSNEATNVTTWNEETHAYKPVKTPVIPGYYADIASVDGAEVTPNNPNSTITVTYKPMGKIVPIDSAGNPIPGAETPTYKNDSNDPTKATTTETPNIKGYNKSESSVTPTTPDGDTQVVYTPIISTNKVPSSQIINYVGAGDQTPKPSVQNDFTFTSDTNETTGQTTWNAEEHTYESVETPVVPGYYADVASVDGAKVTPDNPTSITTVIYHRLGQIIPVDPEGNTIPNAPTPTYNNDQKDPSKGTTTPVPKVPGYTTTITEVTPDDPGANTQITYTPIIKDATVPTSQTVKYEGAGDLTPKDNVQNDYTFTGKSNEATNVTTWDEATHAYKPVETPVIPGYYADVASVDNIVLTPEHPTEEVTVKYRALGRIVPVDPEGNVIPNVPMPTYNNDPSDPTKTTTTPVPDIPGYTTTTTEVTPDDPSANTQITYTPIINEVTVPTSQTVKYEGAGDLTPKDNVQNDYKFTGKSNKATDQTTWDEANHAYKPVTTPVIPGYYADVASVDNIVLTPEHPTEEVTVKYRALGRIVPVDPEGNVVPNAPMPTYSNDPSDPTKTTTTPVPDIPGYTTTITEVTPDDPGANTQITYTPIITKVSQPASQVVKYEGAGDLTPAESIQNNYTFTGEKNEATGEVTWTEQNHSYQGVPTPVIPGYYADIEHVAGAEVTPDNPVSTTIVTYHKLGSLIPVDSNGNPIPNAPTPTYNNDPNNPTQGLATPVPDIPGYKKTVESITPNDPGSDTKVVYVPIKSDDNGTVPSNPGSNTPTGPEQPFSENGNGTVTNEHQTDNQSTTSSTTENDSQNQSNQTNNQSTTSSTTENDSQNQSNQTNNQSTTSSAMENNGQNQSTQAQSLPQTGNDQQEAKGLISLGIASFLGMLGLMGYKKKQER